MGNGKDGRLQGLGKDEELSASDMFNEAGSLTGIVSGSESSVNDAEKFIKDDNLSITGLVPYNKNLFFPEFRNDVSSLDDAIDRAFRGHEGSEGEITYDFWFDDEELARIKKVLSEGSLWSGIFTMELSKIAYHYVTQIVGPQSSNKLKDKEYLKAIGIENWREKYPKEIKEKVLKQTLTLFDKIGSIVNDNGSKGIISKAKMNFAELFKDEIEPGFYAEIEKKNKRVESKADEEKRISKYYERVLKPLTEDFEISPKNFSEMEESRVEMTNITPEKNRVQVANALFNNFRDLTNKKETERDNIIHAAAGCIASIYSLEHYYKGRVIERDEGNGLIRQMDALIKKKSPDLKDMDVAGIGYSLYKALAEKFDVASIEKHSLLKTGIRKGDIDFKMISDRYVRVDVDLFHKINLQEQEFDPLIMVHIGDAADGEPLYHLFKGIGNESLISMEGASTIGITLSEYSVVDGKLAEKERHRKDHPIRIDATTDAKVMYVEKDLVQRLEEKGFMDEMKKKIAEERPPTPVKIVFPDSIDDYIAAWSFKNAGKSKKRQVSVKEFTSGYLDGSISIDTRVNKNLKAIAIPLLDKSYTEDAGDFVRYSRLLIVPVDPKNLKPLKEGMRIYFSRAYEIDVDAITSSMRLAPENRKMEVRPSVRYVGAQYDNKSVGFGYIEVYGDVQGSKVDSGGAKMVYLTETGDRVVKQLNELPFGGIHYGDKDLYKFGEFAIGDKVENPAGRNTTTVKISKMGSQMPQS